jgi:HAD superfamily hydrolase (TIGR01509 family)
MRDCSDISRSLRGKRALIFDFDGTIADTSPLHARAFEETLAPLGIVVDYPKLAGLKTADALEKCLKSAGLAPPEGDLESLVAHKQRRARELIAQELAPVPKIDAFLRWTRERYLVALVTSGSRRTIAGALQKLGYEDWFDPLICADDVVRAKPDPEGFITALRALACQAQEALVFEDSDSGFRAAAAAGLDYVDVRRFDWSIPTAESGPRQRPKQE